MKITTMQAVPRGWATAARTVETMVPPIAPSPRSMPLTIALIAHHCQCAPNSRCPA